MDKEIRDWSVYTHIENLIKNMLTSLRALIELQNPSMKERHWAELMKVTNVMLFSIFILITMIQLNYRYICIG